MDFYNNKKNDTLKFKLNAEGIDMSDIEARLIFKGKDNKSMLLMGAIKEGYCIFDIPELKLYEKDDQGDVKFEVIAGDVYFQPWKNEFSIKSQATMKVEEVINDVLKKEKEKPTISASVEVVTVKKEEKPKPIERKKIFENKENEEEIKINPGLNPYQDLGEIIKEATIEEIDSVSDDEEIEFLPDFKHFRLAKKK